jgi:hypothetical protein
MSALAQSGSYNSCTEIMKILISCRYDAASMGNMIPVPTDALIYTYKKNTCSVRINLTLRRVRVPIVAVEKQ